MVLSFTLKIFPLISAVIVLLSSHFKFKLCLLRSKLFTCFGIVKCVFATYDDNGLSTGIAFVSDDHVSRPQSKLGLSRRLVSAAALVPVI